MSSSSGKHKELEYPVDTRMLDRMLKKGQLSRKEYERITKQAPDAKQKGVRCDGSAI